MRALYFDEWAVEQSPAIGQGSYSDHHGWTMKFGSHLYWRFARSTEQYLCQPSWMDIVTISRRWVFMGITFDASTNKYYCLLDETRFDASIAAVNQPNQRDFNFEARRTYLIDDLIYLPKYVTSDESMVIYNQSTYNYNLFADVILFKMHGGVIDKHSEYFFDFSSYVVMLSSVHMFVLQIGK